jgi:hypothetical protein
MKIWGRKAKVVYIELTLPLTRGMGLHEGQGSFRIKVQLIRSACCFWKVLVASGLVAVSNVKSLWW